MFARYLLTMAVPDGRAGRPGSMYPVNITLNVF
jgi:hypothetical protein